MTCGTIANETTLFLQNYYENEEYLKQNVLKFLRLSDFLKIFSL